MSKEEDSKQKKSKEVEILKELKKSEESNNRSAFKFWTLEFITFVLVIATLATLLINTWEQVRIIPKVQEHYITLETYEKGRLDSFNTLTDHWAKMRVDYRPYIAECGQLHPSEQKLKNYSEQNRKNVAAVKELMSGTMDYYWGKGIHRIFEYDLQWYILHINTCPAEAKDPNVKLNDILHERNEALIQVLRTKMYDPRKDNPYFDNPNYLNL